MLDCVQFSDSSSPHQVLLYQHGGFTTIPQQAHSLPTDTPGPLAEKSYFCSDAMTPKHYPRCSGHYGRTLSELFFMIFPVSNECIAHQ